jgi:GNAT superfamily N-acetyltransferase
MFVIRPCQQADAATLLAIINSAATAYRGSIPEDCWREPYMSREELRHEIASRVAFWGYEVEPGLLVGVMGLQPVRDVWLIRHAYVLPAWQRHGVGTSLMQHLLGTMAGQRVLVGTWAAAHWAIAFYLRHGFSLVAPERKTRLLATYWSIPDRQSETSVVLERSG